MHSVIIAYRNRPDHLSLCLSALTRSPVTRDVSYGETPLEVILIDQASDTDTEAVIQPFLEPLNLKYFRDDNTGPFHKTRLLNIGLFEAQNEIVTTLDCDMLVSPHFFAEIEKHFANKEPPYPSAPQNATSDQIMAQWSEIQRISNEYRDKRQKSKLAHRVHNLDQGVSTTVKQNYGLFNSWVACNPQQFPHYSETAMGAPLGNSQFSMSTDMLASIGGWDERFIGYGLEDHSLNLKLQKAGVETTINTKGPLFHLWHSQGSSGWYEDQYIQKNRQLLEQVKKEMESEPTK